MDDDELFRRREECLRNGIPRSAYIEALARAQQLRREAFADAFRALIRVARSWRMARTPKETAL